MLSIEWLGMIDKILAFQKHIRFWIMQACIQELHTDMDTKHEHKHVYQL